MTFTAKTLIAALAVSAPLSAFANVLDFPQPQEAPDEINVVIEIPAGSAIKYEADAKTGTIIVDRFQSMAVAYPANYGSITSSKGGDGDPLDALVFTRFPVTPGAVIKVRPIGIMKMVHGGETDDKIVAVPTSKVDPSYDAIKTIADLPKVEQDRVAEFFRVYKNLPGNRKKVEVNGFEPADAAKQVVKAAVDNATKK